MKKTILLLSGKISSGKNQFGEFLKDVLEEKNISYNSDYFAKDLKEYSMEDFSPLGKLLKNKADTLKSMIDIFFDIKFKDGGKIKEDLMKEIDTFTFNSNNFFEDKTDITRVLLQLYGTDIARKRFDNHFWIKKLSTRVNDSDSQFIIITDVRFPNEIDDLYSYIDDCNIIPIRIERDNTKKELIKTHSSETALDNYMCWHYIIENKSSLEIFKQSALTIINDILDQYEDDL